MGDYDAWIGRSEMIVDTIEHDRIDGLMALLDKDEPSPKVVPPLGHWLFCRPHVRQSELDADGHPRRGGKALLPPIALPRRMWAGSEVEFVSPLEVGAPIARHTIIAAIDEKRGAGGDMVFVSLDHAIESDGRLAIRERQQIVYRDAPSGSSVAGAIDSREATTSRTAAPDPVHLFRYSALTFNAHRIHYDRDYARACEGYPALVVQGPYAATLMIHHFLASSPAAVPTRFAFRARAPLFDGQPFTICGAGDDLWIRDIDGRTAMTGSVTCLGHAVPERGDQS